MAERQYPHFRMDPQLGLGHPRNHVYYRSTT